MENNYNYFKRIILFFRPFWKWFFLAWFLAIVVNLLTMSYSFAVGNIIDALNKGDHQAAFNWIYFFLGCTLAGKALMHLGYVVEIRKLDFNIGRHIGEVTLQKTKELSIGQHQNQNSGLQQTVIDKGADALSRLSGLIINQISYLFLESLVAIFVMLYFDWKLSLALFIYVILLIVFVVYINKNKAELDSLADLENGTSKAFTDYLRNIAMLLLNANAERGIGFWREKSDSFLARAKKYWESFVSKQSLMQSGNTIFLAGVLFYIIQKNIKGEISVGQTVIFLFWSNLAIGSIQYFIYFQRQLMQISIDVRKYFTFLDIVPDIKKPEKEARKSFKGGIEFKDVSFTYPEWNYFGAYDKIDDEKAPSPAHNVLNSLCLKIHPREKVAIVGLSGAGKSTIIALLMRAYRPDTGSILLDGTDYEKIDPDRFRRQVGIVEQNIQLMDDTLRANLLIGFSDDDKKISDDKLWRVLALANVTKFKDRLTKGLDTLIGEGGVKLSGGEKQRVAIARALLKDPSIIIFDEATSNLDGITEMELREAIENANKDRTSISIAHRLATVINSDRIIVIDNGRVVAEGEHTELKEKCGIYRQLIKTQTAVF